MSNKQDLSRINEKLDKDRDKIIFSLQHTGLAWNLLSLLWRPGDYVRFANPVK